ncbi:MAG: enoyl-CoA hydratase/isomerase family protein, partial [Rhizobacter sp.]|nr:enoyl-CoA hydratase/isomerase family protein [Chlorobiales bacterium]
MNFTQLTYEIQNRIARITLNRPEQRNALTSVLISELRQALRDADSEPDVRVVMLQSTG